MAIARVKVPLDHAEPGVQFDIMLQDQRKRATVLAAPVYDPDNAKMKV